MWDIYGNYIPSEQDKKNKLAKQANREFLIRLEAFMKKHKIIGGAHTYGNGTNGTHLEHAINILKKLKIKYRLDHTPHFHTKIIISKKEI